MLDIVFIMLIFFIVTTSFVKEVGIDINRPANQPIKEQKQSEAIAIRISETGQITIQDRLVDIRSVRPNVVAGLASKPDAAVVVIADRRANADVMVRVIDQAKAAGARNVSLAAPRQR